ncbi:hypothetical protein K438DRAFT_1776769 [Mycena galopus ATCC 62051]|nr:hypothetical protein K438DRAFT_1776769 [Mycena galopus ATCC 62051]
MFPNRCMDAGTGVSRPASSRLSSAVTVRSSPSTFPFGATETSGGRGAQSMQATVAEGDGEAMENRPLTGERRFPRGDGLLVSTTSRMASGFHRSAAQGKMERHLFPDGDIVLSEAGEACVGEDRKGRDSSWVRENRRAGGPHPVQVALQAAGPEGEKEREPLFLRYS